MMLMSCSRDHLYYETVERSNVRLNIDWSQTAFSPANGGYDTGNQLNGVTIFAFDASTHRLMKELPPDPNWQSPVLNLDPGTYSMILINDSRAELPAIRFSPEQGFDGCQAYVDTDTVYTEYPDYLTASAVSDVEILSLQKNYHHDMPDDYYLDMVTRQVNTVQRAVTKKVNIKVAVKGMNYCKGMQPSFITGLAKSVNLATRRAGKETSVYAFNLVNRQYRDSEHTEALLTQSFNSFGFSEENLKAGAEFKLTLNFVLVDNTVHSVTTDVTPQFEKWYEEHQVDVGLDLDLDIDVAMEVELPPAVPPSPEDGEKGLVPETIPWNDYIQNITL